MTKPQIHQVKIIPPGQTQVEEDFATHAEFDVLIAHGRVLEAQLKALKALPTRAQIYNKNKHLNVSIHFFRLYPRKLKLL